MAEKQNFEKMMERLEEIVAVMEKGECDLDDSVKLFEEGVALIGKCEKKLNTAKQKIIALTDAEREANDD